MKLPIFRDKIGQPFEMNDVVAYTSGTCGLKMEIGRVTGHTNRRIRVKLANGSDITSDPGNLIVITQQVAFHQNEVPMDGEFESNNRNINMAGQTAVSWFHARGIDVYKEIQNL